MSILSVKNLNLWYNTNQALKNVSVDIEANTITALIGPSGCGKSTFLKTLNRMNDLIPGVRIEGEVKYGDMDIFGKGVDVNELRRDIGMNGVRRYLYEIIYNLCDNAIRYNSNGGKVDVTVKQEETHTVLSVTDTGIGIAPEHQARIFERFYRVDKSHSKETGGTGLGLSMLRVGL